MAVNNTVANINLPPRPNGVRWTHQSVRAYNGKVVESAVPLTSPDVESDR